MFSSIRWKFIVVYFLLVFIAMSIVGVFIIGKLETQQIKNITDNMEKHIETVIESSTYISKDSWDEYIFEIQETLNSWRIGSGETMYIISNEDVPTIIASTTKDYKSLEGQNALSSKHINAELLLETLNEGEKSSIEWEEQNENVTYQHLSYPVISEVGKVKGIIYMTSDLSDVYKTLNDSKIILTNATLLALSITVVLGFLIASSITTPIRDLTEKAKEMAKGDFDQFVDVKSDDEVGQLANMFNYLTLELQNTISKINFERSKLETIFTYMAEGVVAIDLDNSIIHANITAEELLGLPEDYMNQKIKLNLEDMELGNINYEDSKSLEGTKIYATNGEVFKIKYAPFKNENENIGGVIFVFQDITREHKLDNLRKEFVANVSHELKTPITTIKSYTETLIDSDLDKETSDKFLTVIDDECDRMNRLVMDLLELSNLDYKRTKWNKQTVNINEIIEDVKVKLELSAKEKNQKIKLDLDEDLPNIYIDKDRIEQVLLNVASNSINYTGENGEILISSTKEDDHVVVKIDDNGKGISEEDLKRIFERFYRVEKGRSRDMGGTGLGLSIAKEIVEAHDGVLDIESSLGEGTSVSIKLPIYKL